MFYAPHTPWLSVLPINHILGRVPLMNAYFAPSPGPTRAYRLGGAVAGLRPARRGPRPAEALLPGSDRPGEGPNRWRLRRRARTDGGSVFGLLQAHRRRRPVAGPLPAWRRRRGAPTGQAGAPTSGGSVAGPEPVAAPSPGSYWHVRTAPTPMGKISTHLHVRTAHTPMGKVSTHFHVRTAPTVSYTKFS